jgi:GT2 family glycosyltransferase
VPPSSSDTHMRYTTSKAPGIAPSAPSVVAVVLNWNGSADTLRCLASLRSTGLEALKIVVVDNASTDSSWEELQEAAIADQVMRSDINGGYGAGNNIGIRWALEQGADYVWILNNDTVVPAGVGAQLLEAAESDATVGALGCTLVSIDNEADIQLIGGGRVNWVFGTVRPMKRPGPVDYISGACMFLRGEALADVGLFDECFFMYFEDVDLSVRLVDKGYRLSSVPGAVVQHKGGASLEPTSVTAARHFNRSALRFFGKHASVPIVPRTVGVVGRAAKQRLRGNVPAARAIMDVFREGSGHLLPCYKARDV